MKVLSMVALVLALLLVLLLGGCAKVASTPRTTVTVKPVEAAVTPQPTETTFNDAHDFINGVAWVQRQTDGSWEAIDGTGKTLFELTGGETPETDFYGDSAMVVYSVNQVDPNGGPNLDKAVRIVGKNGQVLFPKGGDAKLYTSGGSLNGYHIVETEISTPEAHETRQGLVDSAGNWMLEPSTTLDAKTYGDQAAIGFMPVNDDEGNYRLLNTNNGQLIQLAKAGEEMSKTKYETTLAKAVAPDIFHDGMVFMGIQANMVSAYGLDFAPVGFKRELPHVTNGNYDGGRAFYGTDRKVAFDLTKYQDVSAENFRDGYLSIILSNGSQPFYTILDKTGKQMFEPIKGNSIQQYARERALVDPTPENDHNNGSFYIDLTGKPVIEGIQLGNPFAANGLARVRLDGADDGTDTGYSFINTDGGVAF